MQSLKQKHHETQRLSIHCKQFPEQTFCHSCAVVSTLATVYTHVCPVPLISKPGPSSLHVCTDKADNSLCCKSKRREGCKLSEHCLGERGGRKESVMMQTSWNTFVSPSSSPPLLSFSLSGSPAWYLQPRQCTEKCSKPIKAVGTALGAAHHCIRLSPSKQKHYAHIYHSNGTVTQEAAPWRTTVNSNRLKGDPK